MHELATIFWGTIVVYPSIFLRGWLAGSQGSSDFPLPTHFKCREKVQISICKQATNKRTHRLNQIPASCFTEEITSCVLTTQTHPVYAHV